MTPLSMAADGHVILSIAVCRFISYAKSPSNRYNKEFYDEKKDRFLIATGTAHQGAETYIQIWLAQELRELAVLPLQFIY